jgi:hypothetical protein
MGYTVMTGNLVIGPVGDRSLYQEYETFTITHNPDGTRTARTLTRSPKGDLLRDVHQTVAADWRPIEAYGRLFLKGQSLGTVLRRVVGDRMHSYAWAPGTTMDVAEFPAPPNLIVGFHPVTVDAWKANFYDLEKGGTQDVYTHTVSSTWNGSTLGHGEAHTTTMDFIGREEVTTPAGTFECERFMWHTSRIDSDLEIWRTGPHNLLVQLIAHDRDTLYQLGRLDVLEVEENA